MVVIGWIRDMTIGDWINVVLAVANGLMVFFTFRLARSTVAGIKQADRHHQEDSRPFCVIEFADAGATAPFGASFQRSQGLATMYPSASGLGEPIRLKGHLVTRASDRRPISCCTSIGVTEPGKNKPIA